MPVAGWSSTSSARASPRRARRRRPAWQMRTVAPATAGSVAKASRPLTRATPSASPGDGSRREDGVAASDPRQCERLGPDPAALRQVGAGERHDLRATCAHVRDLARRHRHEVVGRDPVEPRLGQQRELRGDGVGFEPELLEAAAVERARRGRVPDERAQPALRRARRPREREDAVEVVPGRQAADEPVLEREDVHGLEGRRDAVDGLAGESDLDRDRVAGDVNAVGIVVVDGEVLERADVVGQDLRPSPGRGSRRRPRRPRRRARSPGSRPSPRC